ncbi:ATP-binding protein [Streptomyces thermogriseus]|uniref:ATP-binding protein n=1 Tax=Streptomyces thermogriseus TaxID=75292 RepID=UPI0031F7EAB4
MTTTALRAPRPAHRDGEVLLQRISVASRRGTHPRAEDALRAGFLRRVTAAELRYCGLDALVDDVMLIVSELWTNALLHSGTSEITLSIKVQNGFLHVIVDDGMPGFPVSKAADEEALSGRGLALVDALAKEHGGEWGTTEDGTATWCTLALPQETAS